MRARAFDIEWDTDGEYIHLPDEVFVEVDDESDIVDAVSDEIGFCILSARYEFI